MPTPDATLTLTLDFAITITITIIVRMMPGPSPAPKKIGFFKSLFGHKKGEQEQQKREKDKEEEHEGDRRSPSPGYVSRNSIRRERTATISAESPPPLQYAAPPSCNDTVVPLTRSKTESEVYYENHPQSYIHTHIPTHHSPGEGQTDGCSPTDGGAGSCGGSRPDPRLMDFLRYYKSKDYKLAAFREGNFLQSTPSSPLKRNTRASFSLHSDRQLPPS